MQRKEKEIWNKDDEQRREIRILISQAKANYWKKYRSRGEGDEDERGNDEAWRSLREGILALEEEGGWILDEDALSTRGGFGVNNDKDLPDKDVAKGHVDDDNVGQGTDRDGL